MLNILKRLRNVDKEQEEEKVPDMQEMQRLVKMLENEMKGWRPNQSTPDLIVNELFEKLDRCWDAFNNLEAWQQSNPNITLTNLDEVLDLLNGLEETASDLRVRVRKITKDTKQAKKVDQDSIFVVVVDTETTGLSEDDEAISIGVILLEVSAKTGKQIREIDSYYGLREPSVPINPQAAKVHGLSLRDLTGKDFDIERLGDIFERADIVAAHNAQFDYKMLIKILPRLVYATWGCTCLGLRDYWRHMPNRRLDTICAVLGVQRQEPHNALADSRALVNVLFKPRSDRPNAAPYMLNLITRPWMPYPD